MTVSSPTSPRSSMTGASLSEPELEDAPQTANGHSASGDAFAQLGERDFLYRDDVIAVLNKPSGLLVHRGWAKDRVTALSLVRNYVGCHVYPIHRLDRSCSGALVFALSSEVAQRAQESLVRGEWHKEYLALVRGHPQPSGVIDYPLAKAKDKPKQPALSHYRTLATYQRYALVWVRPVTGRQHQIRRHFRHLSHPLIGDVRYGKAEHNRLFRSEFQLHRLCLHAARLGFPHPVSGERLTLACPLPTDLAEPLAAMGLLQAAQAAMLDTPLAERVAG